MINLYSLATRFLKTNDYGKVIFWGAYFFLVPIQVWPGIRLDLKRKLYLTIQGVLFIFIILGNIAYIYGNFDNFNKYSYAICVLNVPFTASFKLFYMIYAGKKLKYLLDEIMYKFWPYNVINENDSYFITCFKFHNLTWLSLLFVGAFYCASMVLAPVFNEERTLPFPTTLPFNFTSSPTYEILYSIHFFTFQFLIHFIIAGNDLLILAFLLATSQQYYILRSCFTAFDTEIMSKVNKSLRRICLDDLEGKYDEKREFLYRCVRQHQIVLSFTKKLNATLNPLELNQLVISIIAICFGILRITNMGTKPSTDLFSSFAYITAYILQISIDCYIGTYLHYQGSLLSNSIFYCNWENLEDIKLRKDLLLILLQSQRIPQFSSYGLYNMNMESFLKVLRAAFSFYTMMSKVGQ